MNNTMTRLTTLSDHTVAVYPTHIQAEEAVHALKDADFNMKHLSIIGQDYQTEERPIGFVNAGDRMWSWGKYGAFWGGVWGLLFGSALLVLPGFGTLLFAGWIVSALEGALVGASAGVIGGALTSIGIPDNTVLQYESELKAGSFLLFAHGTPEEVQHARDLLRSTPFSRLDYFPADPA